MRLIDADALPRQKMLTATGNGQYEEVDIVQGADIDNAPTVDAMKIDWSRHTTASGDAGTSFTVSVPVKRGRWLNMEKIYDDKAEYITEWQQAECSVCHKWHTTPYMYFFKHYNYCPNCGAAMEGGTEDEIE